MMLGRFFVRNSAGQITITINAKRRCAFNSLKKCIHTNDKILETTYDNLKEPIQEMISMDMLYIAGYNFGIYLEAKKNTETGKLVFWNSKYGIKPT